MKPDTLMVKNVRASRGKDRLTNGLLLVLFEIDQCITWSKKRFPTEIEIHMWIIKEKSNFTICKTYFVLFWLNNWWLNVNIIFDYYLVILPTSKAFNYFRAWQGWHSLRLWPSLVCWQDNCRIPGEWVLMIHMKRYCTKFWMKFRVWPKWLPKRFTKHVISVNL